MKILNHNLDSYKALIFDLDGTLLNSMPQHNRAWISALAENGVTITEQFLMETAGMASERIVKIINERDGISLDPKMISLQKRQKYLQTIDQVEVVKPVLSIIEKYFKKCPLGVITGGSHAVVDMLLPKLGLDHYFEKIICSDDTTQGKDSVEPYVMMADTLKVKTHECLFFDDGDIGLKGATLAGMKVVHVDISTAQVFIK